MIIGLGALLGLGLGVAGLCALIINQPFIAGMLFLAAIVDAIAFWWLHRIMPGSGESKAPGSSANQDLSAALEQRHAAGEIDTETLEKARSALRR